MTSVDTATEFENTPSQSIRLKPCDGVEGCVVKVHPAKRGDRVSLVLWAPRENEILDRAVTTLGGMQEHLDRWRDY